MIKLKKVDYFYPGSEQPALSDVDLNIAPGSFVAIMGRNGSGKSSLARLLNGLLLPTHGQVEVDGLDTRDRKANAAIKKKIGLVMSVPDNQMVAGSVEEDVAFGPENLGLSSLEIASRVEQALDLVGMKEFRYADPFSLSGGQKQRVCIAGMLAMQPQYMIFDEPVTMLGPSEQNSIMQLLRNLHREKQLTVILITHNMQEAVSAERIVVLNEGRVALDGVTEKIIAEDKALSQLGIEPLELVSISRGLEAWGHRPGVSINPVDLTEAICRLKSHK